MRIFFPVGPGYGLMLPVVPLVWAARAAGHEVLVGTTAYVTGVAANCGLPTVDVFPARDVGADLILVSGSTSGDPVPQAGDETAAGLPPGYWDLARELKPFEFFTLAMTEGTIRAGREFGADLVIFPSDHMAGLLTAVALDVPALEVGNRVSWSLRDADFDTDAARNARTGTVPEDAWVVTSLRERLELGQRRPRLVARIDPRPPGLGGLEADARDARDGTVWWPMRYVPYNGGGVLPDWVRQRSRAPRICLTLGTVTPLLSDGSQLASLLAVLGEMDVEVILADHSTDLSRIGPLPPNVRRAGYLPLSFFLETCSLIIHHGGSGTTAAALAYGVPQLMMPDGADNPMAARRVVDLKAGLAIPPRDLSPDAVRGAVGRLLSEPAFAAAAIAVSGEMARQPSPAVVLDRLVNAVSSGG